MQTVREVNEPVELAALSPVWNELLERTAGASFVHSLTWLQLYWRHFGKGKRLRVLVVEDRERVVGILPLVVRFARRSEPVKALAYALDGWGNYYGPIGSDPLATLTAGLDHIRRTPRDWQFIDLAWVDALEDNRCHELALDRAGYPATCEIQDFCATIDLAQFDSWEAYLASRTSRFRKDLRRKEKKLAERGEVTYVRHRTTEGDAAQADPRWDLYDACESIVRASWQGSARAGTALNKDPYRAFYRDCHEAAARAGMLDFSMLLIAGRPVAYQYGYHYRGCVTSLKTGYDQAFAAEGPGTIIKSRVIADSIARGDQTLDLGPEFIEIKRPWLTDERPLHCYTHFPRGAVMAQLVRGKRAMLRWWRGQRAATHTDSSIANGDARSTAAADDRNSQPMIVS